MHKVNKFKEITENGSLHCKKITVKKLKLIKYINIIKKCAKLTAFNTCFILFNILI